MKFRKSIAVAATCALTGAAVAASAQAAGAPPPPKTYGGAKASPYAVSGIDNVTSFAWVGKTLFLGSSGNSEKTPNGGVYAVNNGTGTKISPPTVLFVSGLAYHGGVLYVAAMDIGAAGPQGQILAWSGWNGTTFTSQKAIYTAPKGFQGFNGVAFGPDGRLYVGVDAGLLDSNDHGPATTSPYVYDILSMKTDGSGFKVFAKGIRQPWQMVFAPGSSQPYVSDLGQDNLKAPPDFLLKVKSGANYGFPKCNWTKATVKACAKYAKPFETLSPHLDPMGMAIIGKTLYFTSYAGTTGKGGGAVYSTPLSGGKVKPVVVGLPLAADALAAHGGSLYVGGSNQSGAGVVYTVKP